MSNRIARLDMYTARVPLPRPVYLGEARIEHRDFAIAIVESTDGHRGWGYGFTRGTPVTKVGRSVFIPVLIGEVAEPAEALWTLMYDTAFSRQNTDPVAMRALSVIDIALWDLKARRAGRPLYEILGGKMQSLPVMVPAGYRRAEDPAYTLQRELTHYREQGVAVVKLMYTADQLAAHPEYLVAARETLGSEIRLGNDFQASAHDGASLTRILASVEAAALDFVEDPFPLDQTSDFESLCQEFDGEIVTGETITSMDGASRLCASNWIAATRFDATLCGGVTAWLRMREMSNARNRPVWPHCFPEIHLHLAAATGQPYVETPLPEYETVNFGALLDGQLTFRRGRCQLPQAPGIGAELNQPAFENMRIE